MAVACRCCEQTSLHPCPVARDRQGRHPSGRGRRGRGPRLAGCWGPGRASGSARCHRKDSTTSGAFSGLAKSPATMTVPPGSLRERRGNDRYRETRTRSAVSCSTATHCAKGWLSSGRTNQMQSIEPMGFSAFAQRPASAVRSSALNRAAGASMLSQPRMATDHAARASSVVLQGCWGRPVLLAQGKAVSSRWPVSPVLLAQGRRSCCVLTRGDTRNRGSGPKRAGVAASGSCP